MPARVEDLLRKLAPRVLGALVRRYGHFDSSEDAVQVALTLRAVGGLTTAEIARAFMVPEATMAQRISRAKKSIISTGIGFQLPPAAGTDPARRRPGPARRAGPDPLEPGVHPGGSGADHRHAGSGADRALPAPGGDHRGPRRGAARRDTDWRQILALYELLSRVSPNPMVTLNHAVARAMVHGPRAGLELLEALDADARLAGHHRLDAVRAHLLEMAGDHAAAPTYYRQAARRTTTSLPEQRYLQARAARLAEDRSASPGTSPTKLLGRGPG